MARWPGRIKPGSVIAEPFWSPDLLIACTELAGAKLPDDRIYDGKNPLPILTEGAKSPHESFFFIYRRHAALRKGDWKIVREKPDQPWQLFHLAKDLGETQDLASDHPERVAELTAAFADWEKSF
jgi:arylsulfatase A-like enzyme